MSLEFPRHDGGLYDVSFEPLHRQSRSIAQLRRVHVPQKHDGGVFLEDDFVLRQSRDGERIEKLCRVVRGLFVGDGVDRLVTDLLSRLFPNEAQIHFVNAITVGR